VRCAQQVLPDGAAHLGRHAVLRHVGELGDVDFGVVVFKHVEKVLDAGAH